MIRRALKDDEEIDATGSSSIKDSTQGAEQLPDPRLKQPRINYIKFGRYKVGFLEDEEHRVLGISSIEIMKDFYDIDQLPNNDYWDEEAYYD